jgi:hypothetical protein
MQPLTFRPATLDDAAFAADVFTAVRPQSPTDPVLLRYSWETAGPSWVVERFVVERSGTASGFAFTEHPRWHLTERRFASVGGELWPAERHNVDSLLGAMEERALAGGADLLRTRANEDDPERIAAVLRRGYREDRRGKRWELDLVANRERVSAMAEASRARACAARTSACSRSPTTPIPKSTRRSGA